MSERTAPALSKLDEFAPIVRGLPHSADTAKLIQETEALRRAISSFHMEAIRFRMYNVELLLRQHGDQYPAVAHDAFAGIRQALEAAGFHTRSHAAPDVTPKG